CAPRGREEGGVGGRGSAHRAPRVAPRGRGSRPPPAAGGEGQGAPPVSPAPVRSRTPGPPQTPGPPRTVRARSVAAVIRPRPVGPAAWPAAPAAAPVLS